MNEPKKRARPVSDVVRRAQEDPGRGDVHEQRVPDQAAEGSLEQESESTRRARPPTVDEVGGH